VRRLTAATLPAAEAAPTAREDWRSALRNILKQCVRIGDERRAIAADVQLGRGEIEAGGIAFAEEQDSGEFLQRRATGHGAESEGEKKRGGARLIQSPLRARFCPGNPDPEWLLCLCMACAHLRQPPPDNFHLGSLRHHGYHPCALARQTSTWPQDALASCCHETLSTIIRNNILYLS
jgi:hypothetical protein